MNPFFERCTDAFFTGFDPPRTLAPAAALVPTTTTKSPEPSPTAPKPSPTPDAGAKKTANSEPPMITPTDTPAVGQPQNPNSQAPDPKQEPSDPGGESHDSRLPENNPGQRGPDLEETSGDRQQGKTANTVPVANPPFVPVPMITPGVSNEGSGHNTDPVRPNVPPPGGDANPVAGELAETHDQPKPNDPQQTHNAVEAVGDPREKNPSEINPLVEVFSDLREHNPGGIDANENTGDNEIPSNFISSPDVIGESGKENPSRIDPSSKGMQDAGLETPSQQNPSPETMGEPGKGVPSTFAPSFSTVGDPGTEDSRRLDPSVETTENPKEEFPSKFDPLFGKTGDHEKDSPGQVDPFFETIGEIEEETPSKFDSLVKAIENAEKESPSLDPFSETIGNFEKENPSKFNSLLEAMEDAEKEGSDSLDPTFEPSLASESGEDGTLENDPDMLDERPQQNTAVYKLDPFHITPKQILRIKAALSLSAQHVQTPPKSAQNQNGAPFQHASSEIFRHRIQTEGFYRPGLQSTLQSSSSNDHAIIATPTAASDTSRTTLSPAPVSINGTLSSANATETSAAFAQTDKNSTGDVNPTAEVGPEGTNFLSRTQPGSSATKKNTGIQFQLLNGTKWVVLAICTFVWMG